MKPNATLTRALERSGMNVAIRSFNPYTKSFGEWTAAQLYLTWDHPQSLLVEFADGTTAVWGLDSKHFQYEIAIGKRARCLAL